MPKGNEVGPKPTEGGHPFCGAYQKLPRFSTSPVMQGSMNVGMSIGWSSSALNQLQANHTNSHQQELEGDKCSAKLKELSELTRHMAKRRKEYAKIV